MDEQLKICTKCRIPKTINCFSSEHPNRRVGKTKSQCKECCNAHMRSWYQSTKMKTWSVSDGKKCNTCGLVKSIDRFSKRMRRAGSVCGLNPDCRECNNKKQREIYRIAKENGTIDRWRDRAGSYFRKYGITIEQYEELAAIQKDKCAICGGYSPIGRRLAVDHDHATGKVRGLLCTTCNVAIGLLQEDPDMVLRLLNYMNGQKSACNFAEDVIASEARAAGRIQ